MMTLFPPGAVSQPQKPVLYAPQHLRRWRAAVALAQTAVVPIVCSGDSITWGVGSDGTVITPNATALAHGWVGQLQAMFGASPRTLLQNPGEGFIFPDDSRVTAAGGANQNLWACTPCQRGFRLIGAAETLTFTVPAGVTSVTVIQANMPQAFNAAGSNLADVTGQYNINGGANTGLTALTSTGLPVTTAVAVTAGQAFQVIGPATAQTYICGFLLNSAAANGVQIHRIAVSGHVAGDLLGGQNSGVLNQAGSPVNQVYAERSFYAWAPVPGLIICSFTVNDQQFSLGGGGATQNGVTLPLFTAWVQQFAAQAVADGWCVLMFGEPRDQGYAGSATLDQYIGALKTIAMSTDHVAFLDTGELWGPYASSQADGMQVPGSVHPSLAGHGDMAALLYGTLLGQAWSGITELVSG